MRALVLILFGVYAALPAWAGERQVCCQHQAVCCKQSENAASDLPDCCRALLRHLKLNAEATPTNRDNSNDGSPQLSLAASTVWHSIASPLVQEHTHSKVGKPYVRLHLDLLMRLTI